MRHDIHTLLRRIAATPQPTPADLLPLLTLCARSHAWETALHALPTLFSDPLDPRHAQLHHTLTLAQSGIATRFPPFSPLTPHALILPHTLTFTPNHLAALSPTHTLLRWTLDTGRPLLPLPLQLPAPPTAMARFGDTPAVATSDGAILTLPDLRNIAPPLTPPAISLHAHPQALLAVLEDNTLLLLPTPGPSSLLPTRYRIPQDLPPRALHHPLVDFEHGLVAASTLNTLHLWHLHTGFPLRLLRRIHHRMDRALRAQGRRRTRRPSTPSPPPDAPITGPPRSPRLVGLQSLETDTLLVLFEDGIGGHLRIDDDTLLQTFDLGDSAIAATPTHLITAHAVHPLPLQQAASPLPATLFPTPDGCCFDPRGLLLIGDRKAQELWRDGQPALWSLAHPSPPDQLDLTPNGAILFSADLAGTVRWWSAASGALLGVILPHRPTLRALPQPNTPLELTHQDTPILAMSTSLPHNDPDHPLTALEHIEELRFRVAGHPLTLQLHELGHEGPGLRMSPTPGIPHTLIDDEGWSCELDGQRLPLPLDPESEIYASRLMPDRRSLIVSTDAGLLRIRWAEHARPLNPRP